MSTGSPSIPRGYNIVVWDYKWLVEDLTSLRPQLHTVDSPAYCVSLCKSSRPELLSKRSLKFYLGSLNLKPGKVRLGHALEK